jgi:hypothetical protein
MFSCSALAFTLTDSNIPFSLLSGFSTLLRLGIEMLSIDCEIPLVRIGIKGNNSGTLTLLLIS